jgi:DNA-binding NarL/FixJ family response regulator
MNSATREAQPKDDDQSTSIVIVDDHALFRDGLREILNAHEDLIVVGEASDSKGAVALAAEKRPHVVLLDVEIPGEDVTATVSRIRSLAPDSAIVILSMYEGPQLLKSLVQVGVRGYLLKSAHRQELVVAVRSVRHNPDRVMLSVSWESLAQLHGVSGGVLSGREREILEMTAQALSNTQIAHRLGLAEATVKRHLRNIFIKLGAVSRIDAVNKAIVASMIAVPERNVPSPR